MSLEEDYNNLLDVYITDYQKYKNEIEPLFKERKEKYKKYNILANATKIERDKLKTGMLVFLQSYIGFQKKYNNNMWLGYLPFDDITKHFIPEFDTDYFARWDPENKEHYEFDDSYKKYNGVDVITQNEYNLLFDEITYKRHQYKRDIKYVKENIGEIDEWTVILIVYKDIIVKFRNVINDRFTPILKQGNKRVPEELYSFF